MSDSDSEALSSESEQSPSKAVGEKGVRFEHDELEDFDIPSSQPPPGSHLWEKMASSGGNPSIPQDSEISDRFRDVDDQQVQEYTSGPSGAPRTIKATKTATSQFNAFARAKDRLQLTTETVKDYPTELLHTNIIAFIMSARKKKGGEYKAGALKGYVNGVARFLRDHEHPGSDILNSKSAVAKALDKRIGELARMGLAEPTRAKAFDEDILRALLDSPACDETNPEGLLSKTFILVNWFIVARPDEMFNLKLSQIRRDPKFPDDMEYIEYWSKNHRVTASNLSKGQKLAAIPHNEDPKYCPVRVISLYLSKRPETARDNENFWLTENVKATPAPGTAWFKNMRVGENRVRDMVKTICAKSGIDIQPALNERLSNYSLRRGAVTTMGDHGVDRHEIMLQSGHRSAEGIQPYIQVSKKRRIEIAKSLALSSPPPKQAGGGSSSKQPAIPSPPPATSTTSNDPIPELPPRLGSFFAGASFSNCTFHFGK